MKRMIVLAMAVSWWSATPVEAAKTLYENDFEKAAVDGVTQEFLVLAGDFTVKQEGTNKFLELPGAPLETFGVLFGPTEKEGVVVSARILGTSKGRRAPAFGVGLNGGTGYRLQMSPSKGLVELSRGDDVKASVPYEWATGKWTRFRLEVRKTKEGHWKIAGKVWLADAQEPENPTIVWDDS